MTTATLQVKLNGGAVQTGGVAANLNDSVQLTAADKTGWGNPPTKWQIYDYPKGFALPTGWTQDTDGSYYVLGSADPPAFTVNPWGFYGTRLFVLGGASVVNGATDETTAVRVLSPSGLKDPGRREDGQFGSVIRRSVESFKDNLRILEGAVNNSVNAAAAVALTNATQTITYAGGSWRTIAVGLLTGAITITLGTTGAVAGNQIRITRYDVSTYGVGILNGGVGAGTLFTMGAGPIDALFQFDGTNWALREGDQGTANVVPYAVCTRDASSNCAFGSVSLSNVYLSGGSYGASTPSITTSASAGGVPLTVQAGNGGAGQVGGDLYLTTGNGGTPGTNPSGAIHLGVGALVGSVSQPVTFEQNGTVWLTVKQISASAAQIVTPLAAIQTSTLQPNAIRAPAAALAIQDSTGGTALTCALASGGACAVTAAPGVTSMTYGQTQAASGAGVGTTVQAQQGFAGSIGGDLFLKSGAGGTPGTNAAGTLRLDVGALVSGASSKISCEAATVPWLTFQQTSATGVAITTPIASASLTVSAPTLSISASTAQVVATNLQMYGYGSTFVDTPSFSILDYGTGVNTFAVQGLTNGRVTTLCGSSTTTTNPVNSGDLVVRLVNCATEPTASCDATGATVYCVAGGGTGRVKIREHFDTQTELSYTDTATGAAYKKVLHRRARTTIAVAATTAIFTIPAADFPLASKYKARIVWYVTGVNNTGSTFFAATLQSLATSINGTTTAIINDSNGNSAGLMGAATNGTADASLAYTCTTASNNVSLNLTTSRTDSLTVDVWCEIFVDSLT